MATKLLILLLFVHQGFALRCYVCSGRFRDGGNCFVNKLNEDQLEECPEDEEYCSTNIRAADMFGAETVRLIERSCSSTSRTVSRANANNVAYTRSCQGDECNTHGPMFIDPPSEDTTAAPAECKTPEPDGAASLKSIPVLVFCTAILFYRLFP